MDLSDLTPQQAHELAQRRAPHARLPRAADEPDAAEGWSAADPAYAAVWTARDAVHELCVHLHDRGTGIRAAAPTAPEPRGPRPDET